LKLRIAIDGFGRIGRSLFREILDNSEYEVVHISDLMSLEMAHYLLKYDSVHGRLQHKSSFEDNRLFINGLAIEYGPITQNNKIDILFVCHNEYTSIDTLLPYQKMGIKRVILSSMPSDDMPVFSMGINHNNYNNETIFSTGSCTTNALGLILQEIDTTFSLQSGNITSIHSYTSDQNILDASYNGSEFQKSRAAAINIIPVNSGVTSNLKKLLPNIAPKLMGHGVRVPTENVSMLDISLILEKENHLNDFKIHFKKMAIKYSPWLKIDLDNKVSRDYIGDKASVSVSLNKLQYNVATKNLHIVAWHDNEIGYVAAMVAMIKKIEEGL
jgi:glyceraldehyde 3-phosphate dehydrogenase